MNQAAEIEMSVQVDDPPISKLIEEEPVVADGGMFDNPLVSEGAENDDAINPDAIKISLEPPREQKVGVSLAGAASRSQKSRSAMKQSASGFDIGQTQAVGSFFSVERQKQEHKDDAGFKPNFADSAEMSGKKFVDKLIDQQEDRYQKRLPFERGQFH